MAVNISKSFLINLTVKNLEYQDYNDYITIFITIMVSLLMLFNSTMILFWKKLVSEPVWFIVFLLIFIGFEIVFFFLFFYFNKQKKEKRNEIMNLK